MSNAYRLWNCDGKYATRLKNHINSIRPFWIILIFSGTLSSHSYSQSKKVLKLPAHIHVATVSWYDSIYRFPDFQDGRITFSTGFSPKQIIRLNYNLYFLQLDMINEKGDTLKLKPSKEMKLFDIGGHLFYYDPREGYVEILLDSPIALGVLTKLVTVGMDYVSGNTDGSSLSVDVRGQTSVYDRYYRKLNSYFFIDQKDKLHQATKFSIVRLFPSHKESIQAYLQENYIDFNLEHDLIQLLNFCNELNQPLKSDTSGLFIVKNGINIAKAWYDSLYRFANFQEAKITYQGATELLFESAVNYNLLTGEMDVINENGDTVKVKNSGAVKNIIIDEHVFHHDYYQGYVEVLMNSRVSLAASKILDIQIESEVITDKSSKLTAVRSWNNKTKNNVKNPIVNYDRAFKKKINYFFLDDGRLYPASKHSLLTLFPKNQATISAYVKQNNIDFKKERDLKSLLSFCNELPSSNY